ncbi:MAG: hypothetical protein MRY78_07850 [Saprospiraceae bacterium]|nr:hypothetical protein [Saprospiraceae bacterium]
MRLFSQYYEEEVRWPRLFQRLLFKLGSVLLRLLDIALRLPKRLLFLMEHLSEGFSWGYARLRHPQATARLLRGIGFWWMELFMLVIDCLGISEFYESICYFVKFNTRPLHDWEKDLAREIFGESLPLRRVRIDESAWIGPPQYHLCYVSFYTINSWGPMTNSLLVHEMVHVWQYHNKGIVYIPRALAAGASAVGYNYGGVEALKRSMQMGGQFDDFNYEQQADIVSDYYRIKNNYQPSWGHATASDLPTYTYFVQFLRKK